MRAVIQALRLSAEIYGRQMSEAAAAMLLADLRGYPERAVLEALSRCRKELRTFPTVSDIIARIDDGRPGPEEAWATLPRDEADTVVWTTEVAEAFGAASSLIGEDLVGARMAFTEKYRKLVAEARAQGRPAKWTVSLGHDRNVRERVITEAVKLGKIGQEEARILLPAPIPPTARQNLIAGPASPGSDDPMAPVTDALGAIRALLEKSGGDLKPKPKPAVAGVVTAEPTPEELEEKRQAMLRQLRRMEEGA